jgi:hypothetical protein
MKNPLLINQISKGQRNSFQFTIEPDAKFMQADCGSQMSDKSYQVVRTLTSQAKSIQEFARSALLRIMGHYCCAIKILIEALLSLHPINQRQCKGCGALMMRSHLLRELSSIWQIRKRFQQVLLSIAVKGAFAGDIHPLPKQSQCDRFATRQSSFCSWMSQGQWSVRWARIIYHDVEYGYEGGIHVL